MPVKRRLLCLTLCALGCFFASRAMAAPPRDITGLCKIEGRSRATALDNLFDGNPHTAWNSANSSGQHLSVYKPRGVATLSVLWKKTPKDLSLRQYRGDELLTLQSFTVGEDIPDSFVLPEEPGVYYLCSDQGGLSIAQLRVHDTVLNNYFISSGYPASPVNFQDLDWSQKPIRRGARGPEVKATQERLAELGYYHGKAHANFDEATYVALIEYQRANELYANGILEAATRQALAAPQRALAPEAPPSVKPRRTASALAKYFLSKVGAGYIYGATGQICSPTVRGASTTRYPEYTEIVRNYGPRWDGAQVFDCIGLFKSFLENSEGEFPKKWRTNVSGSVFQWMPDVQPIETMPNQPGIILLQEKNTTGGFMHIGLYIGDGLCVHSRGHRYGVVAEPMPQLWTHWARATWLTYDLPEQKKADWPTYMGADDRVLVDTSSGNALNFYSKPIEDTRYFIGVRAPNYTEIRIKEVPEGDSYWRIAYAEDASGRTRFGYVLARDLSPLDPPVILPDHHSDALAAGPSRNATVE